MSESPVELLPARMVNEFVYCPRLFYFEWVRKEWADSDDTAEGDLAHHSIGHRGGKMPEPEADQTPLMTASVSLENPILGLTAIIDRVDHDDGSCSPVDYKKGHAARDSEAWPADKAQVLVQALLLEAAGYRVDHALLIYRASDDRVQVPWNDETREWVQSIIKAARLAADCEEVPGPLLNSPKCPGCSLVSLCIPDETNVLLHNSDRPARTITPRNPDRQPLYVLRQGTHVGVSGKSLVVSVRDEPQQKIRILDVSHLCLIGNVQASTQALHAVWRAGGDVVWLSYGGWLSGYGQGAISRNVAVRMGQIDLCRNGLAVAKEIVRGKIENQRVLLRRNVSSSEIKPALARMKTYAQQAQDAAGLPSLLGLEGMAAKEYFQHFHRCFSNQLWATGFLSNGRKRRPSPDPVNAVLGFVYALLVKEVLVAVTAAGFDPYIGVMHRPRFGHPAFALDLAEEFRPIVGDSVVLQCFNNGELKTTDFRVHSLGTQLTDTGRKAVIKAFERRLAMEIVHPVFGYKVSYRRIIDVQARILAAVATGELPQYTAFTVR